MNAAVEKPLTLVVVGAQLRAEIEDRAIAYRLREAIDEWYQAFRPGTRHEVVVCTDVVYLNQPGLREATAVSVGGVDVNAATAMLAEQLPSVYVIDDTLMVQFDQDAGGHVAVCWGIDARTTAQAVEVFIDRHLHAFLGAQSVVPG